MATETKAPDTLAASTNFTGAVSAVDEPVALVFYDSFTEASNTNLESHTPDVGTSWTKQTTVGTASSLQIVAASDMLHSPDTSAGNNGVAYVCSPAPSTADYTVSVTISSISGITNPNGAVIVLFARYVDVNNHYVMIIYPLYIDGYVSLFKRVGSTYTAVTSDATKPGVAVAGDIYTLSVSGTWISALKNGAEIMGSTDSAFSAAGVAGIGYGAGPGITNFASDQIDPNLFVDNFTVALIADKLAATDTGLATEARFTFPTPTGFPTAGAGLQAFRALLNKTPGRPIPTIDMTLHESGGAALATILDNTSIDSQYGKIITGTWNANLLGTASGANAEVKITSTVATSSTMPTFIAKGVASATTGTSLTPTHPAGGMTGDIMILVVGSTAPTNVNSITTPTTTSTPWNVKHALEGSSLDGQIAIWWRVVSTAVPSGTLTITVATPDANAACYAQIYLFRGLNQINPFEGGALTNGSGTTVSMPSVTTVGANRLCAAFTMVGSNTTMASATGESGGDWVEAAAEDASATGNDGTLGCQIAQMAAAGTISGGSFAVTTGGWACRAFALRPEITTVEISAVEWLVDYSTSAHWDLTIVEGAGASAAFGGLTVSYGSLSVPAYAAMTTSAAPITQNLSLGSVGISAAEAASGRAQAIGLLSAGIAASATKSGLAATFGPLLAAMAASVAVGGQATTVAALTNGAAAAENLTGRLTLFGAFAETVQASAVLSTQGTSFGVVNEAAAASEVVTSVSQQVGLTTAAANVQGIQTALATTAAAVTADVAAAAALLGRTVFFSTLVELVVASDVRTALATAQSVLQAAAGATETTTGAATQRGQMTAAAGADAAVTALATAIATLAASIAVAGVQAGLATSSAQILEAVLASAAQGGATLITSFAAIPPDAIIDDTNLSGVVTSIQDDPDASPGTGWLVAVDATGGIELYLSFGSPPMETISGEQNFKIWLRKTAGDANPTIDVELWEDGSFVATLLSGVEITSTTGQLVIAPWEAAQLVELEW